MNTAKKKMWNAFPNFNVEALRYFSILINIIFIFEQKSVCTKVQFHKINSNSEYIKGIY